MTPTAIANPEVDLESGEVYEQLMFGIVVPSTPVLEVQRKGLINTTEAHFNLTRWQLEEGDSMAVKVKDGRWLVTLKKAWEQE